MKPQIVSISPRRNWRNEVIDVRKGLLAEHPAHD
jgi:hypothetical protein